MSDDHGKKTFRALILRRSKIPCINHVVSQGASLAEISVIGHRGRALIDNVIEARGRGEEYFDRLRIEARKVFLPQSPLLTARGGGVWLTCSLKAA